MKQLTFIKETQKVRKPHFTGSRFKYQDYKISAWFVDLPEYLEAGLGTKANLAMVAGADTFLDLLKPGDKDRVKLDVSTVPFEGYDARLMFKGKGMDPEELAKYNHPEVEFGGYYDVKEYKGEPFHHEVWLCPVALYVFDGTYPREIFIKVIE